MTLGVTDVVPWFDRLLARFEVSRLAVVPFSISLFAAPLSWLIPSLALFGGRRAAILAMALFTVWLVPVGLEQARGWWLGRHPMPRHAGCAASVPRSVKRCSRKR